MLSSVGYDRGSSRGLEDARGSSCRRPRAQDRSVVQVAGNDIVEVSDAVVEEVTWT